MSRSVLIFLLSSGFTGLVPCESGASELLVAAAADLANLEWPVAAGFRQATGHKLRFTLASSGMLAQQIQRGAPYDVYLSANEKFVKDLVTSGYLDGNTVCVYAYGRIGLWSKSGAIRTVSDLVKPHVLHVAIANPSHAPYGQAAKESLENQGAWRTLGDKIVYAENVRQALEYAQSGNAEAAITAWSLVFDKGAVLLPENWHSPIRQAGGVVKSSAHREAARQFLEFLTGEDGKKLLQRFGLFPPTPSGGRDRIRPSGR